VSSGRAQDQAEVQPADLKATYLLNFLRYTVWPASSFAGPEAPLHLLVVGDDAVADALLEILRRSPLIAGRQLEVSAVRLPGRQLRDNDDAAQELRRAHAVYVDESDDEQVARLLEVLDGHDVLTVGGRPRFAALGGMIGLREEGRRIVFEANPVAIRQSTLQVSARVLQLARVVGREGSK
jgi:hypothetical protein